MRCFNHPSDDAVGLCQQCGRASCKGCVSEIPDVLICLTCARSAAEAVILNEEDERRHALRHLERSHKVAWGGVGCGLLAAATVLLSAYIPHVSETFWS